MRPFASIQTGNDSGAVRTPIYLSGGDGRHRISRDQMRVGRPAEPVARCGIVPIGDRP